MASQQSWDQLVPIGEGLPSIGYHPGYGAHFYVPMQADATWLDPTPMTTLSSPGGPSPYAQAVLHLPIIPIELADMSVPPPSYQFRFPDITQPPPAIQWRWVGDRSSPCTTDSDPGGSLSTVYSSAFSVSSSPPATVYPQWTSAPEESELEAQFSSLSLDIPRYSGATALLASPQEEQGRSIQRPGAEVPLAPLKKAPRVSSQGPGARIPLALLEKEPRVSSQHYGVMNLLAPPRQEPKVTSHCLVQPRDFIREERKESTAAQEVPTRAMPVPPRERPVRPRPWHLQNFNQTMRT